jgi:mannosyltransferase
MAVSKRKSPDPAFKAPAVPETQTDSEFQPLESAVWWGAVLLAFGFALRGIAYSLWLDETATFWVVKDGFRHLFARAFEWTGASVVYDITAWAGSFLAPVIGLEPALRLPSLLAMIVAAFLLYRLGRILADRRTAALSVIAFLCIYEVSFAAIDARPYALGLALLLASMLYFWKYLDSQKRLHAVLYVVTSTLVVYTHYLIALALVAQLVYGWRFKRKLALLWLAIGALCVPLSGQLLNSYSTRKSHSFAPAPELSAIVAALAPPALAAAVFLTVILSRRAPAAPRQIPYLFLLIWAFFPPVFLFLISTFTDTSLFMPRYFLGAAPALALLAGHALSRRASVLLSGAALVLVFGIMNWHVFAYHALEDWRGAMAALNAQAAPADPVLVASGFVEGTPEDINRRDVLFSPQLAYPISHMFRLPHDPSERALPPDLVSANRIFFVGFQSQMQYPSWIVQRLRGYRAQPIGTFGEVVVIRFDR